MRKMLLLALAVIGGCFMVTFQASALAVSDSVRIDDVSHPRRLQPGESFLACYTSSGVRPEHVKSILAFLNWRLSGEEISVFPYTLVGTETSAGDIHHSTERHGEAVIVRKPYQVEYMQPTFPDDIALFCAVVRKM
jgi:hypothetical protein